MAPKGSQKDVSALDMIQKLRSKKVEDVKDEVHSPSPAAASGSHALAPAYADAELDGAENNAGEGDEAEAEEKPEAKEKAKAANKKMKGKGRGKGKAATMKARQMNAAQTNKPKMKPGPKPKGKAKAQSKVAASPMMLKRGQKCSDDFDSLSRRAKINRFTRSITKMKKSVEKGDESKAPSQVQEECADSGKRKLWLNKYMGKIGNWGDIWAEETVEDASAKVAGSGRSWLFLNEIEEKFGKQSCRNDVQ